MKYSMSAITLLDKLDYPFNAKYDETAVKTKKKESKKQSFKLFPPE